MVGETAAAASTVAAGMLAPVTETTFTEELLLGLNLASMQRYPSFAAEVEQASGLPSGFRAGATLSIAYNADDAARMTALADYLGRLGLESSRLTSREARKIEPLLAPTVRAGLLVPGDASCDNRQLLAALTVAGERAGVRAAIAAKGAELRLLPPYSPDRNPIEKVFSKLIGASGRHRLGERPA